jgi:hypothetical protein
MSTIRLGSGQVQKLNALKEAIVMATQRYEYCEVADICGHVEEHLRKLPAPKGEDESPAEFWSRVERAGLLSKALALYDEIEAACREWRHTRRETKKQFDQRMEREGRQTDAERVRTKLLASGMSRREAQVKLVERFQPLDGSTTRAWETPDPWESGRLFRNKADQDERLRIVKRAEDEDYDEEFDEAKNRIFWAELRREERQALADARRRAQALKMDQMKRSRSRKQAAKSKSSANAPQQKKGASARRGRVDRVVI